MKNFITTIIITTIAISLLFAASCKKDKVENPTPGPETELITTLQLTAKDLSSGLSKAFTYKVENGFGSSTQGLVSVDTIVLNSGASYTFTVKLLNEKATPAADLTQEVIDEKDKHLFIYASVPASGVGSIAILDGNKDNQGRPFRQETSVVTGGAGTGKLTVTLKHEPADKAASTADAAGGETDAEAVFPVMLK